MAHRQLHRLLAIPFYYWHCSKIQHVGMKKNEALILVKRTLLMLHHSWTTVCVF